MKNWTLFVVAALTAAGITRPSLAIEPVSTAECLTFLIATSQGTRRYSGREVLVWGETEGAVSSKALEPIRDFVNLDETPGISVAYGILATQGQASVTAMVLDLRRRIWRMTKPLAAAQMLRNGAKPAAAIEEAAGLIESSFAFSLASSTTNIPGSLDTEPAAYPAEPTYVDRILLLRDCPLAISPPTISVRTRTIIGRTSEGIPELIILVETTRSLYYRDSKK